MWRDKGTRIKRLTFLLAVILCFSCVSCGRVSGERTVSKTYFLMDTVIEIKLRCGEETAAPVFSACGEIMSGVEAVLSRTVSDSAVSRFNTEGQWQVDAAFSKVVQTALDVSGATDGAFDPTVEPIVSLWKRCEEQGRLPAEEELRECLAHVGTEHLVWEENTLTRTDPATALDLGALGKGYAIDLVVDYLEKTEVPGGVVSFGGNVAVFGAKKNGEAYRIGLRDPQNTAGVLGYLSVPSGVISVSGDYERYVTINGARYHHIIDPKTGYPAESGLRSVAVLCEDGTLADALSTALFVMGVEEAMALYESAVFPFEAVFVTEDEIILTEGLAEGGRFEHTAKQYRLAP